MPYLKMEIMYKSGRFEICTKVGKLKYVHKEVGLSALLLTYAVRC